MIFADDFMR